LIKPPSSHTTRLGRAHTGYDHNDLNAALENLVEGLPHVKIGAIRMNNVKKKKKMVRIRTNNNGGGDD
jgi:hypothetical protein